MKRSIEELADAHEVAISKRQNSTNSLAPLEGEDQYTIGTIHCQEADGGMDASLQDKEGEVRRLVDLPDALQLFSEPNAASQAKIRGVLKNWPGVQQYEEIESKVVSVLRDQADGVDLSEEMIVAAVPELLKLETATFERFLEQFARFAKFERAASQLVEATRDAQRRIAVIHAENELEALRERMQAESDAAAAAAQQELQQVQAAAAESAAIDADRILELERQLAHAQERDALKSKQLAWAEARLAEAETETDVKRQTSLKLKAEVIENDRLTMATLNRVKQLESDLRESRREVAKLRSAGSTNGLAKQAEEVRALQELLQEREAMVLSLSRRLEAAKCSSHAASKGPSLFDRIKLPHQVAHFFDQ